MEHFILKFSYLFEIWNPSYEDSLSNFDIED